MPLRSKPPARPAARSAGLPACLRPEHADGAVNRHAYTFCVLEQFWRHLKRREIYAESSTRWRNPQAQLLDGPAWEAIRGDVLTTLSACRATPVPSAGASFVHAEGSIHSWANQLRTND